MLEVYLLGTGGMVPLPDRYLTSLLVRYGGESILIDCGEGTQMALRAAGQGFKGIGTICLTHFHADHVAGLPGLLLTIGNSGRTEPLTVIGPQHVGQMVDCLRVIAPQLPFPVEYVEIQAAGSVFRLGDLTISTCPVEHWIPCHAYRMDLARRPRFDAQRARALNIPVQLWSMLQRGEPVEVDGAAILPDQVMGQARRGIGLCYATDLRPSDELSVFASGVDLFICEGMYGDSQMQDKAIEHKHCLFSEAARMAHTAGVEELWLTHFSPSMPEPELFLQEAASIFPNVYLDRHSVVLRFAEA